MESKGIYTKENVANGVYIFTSSKKFVSPKFWGVYEETEKAECAVIVTDGNVLAFYPKDMSEDYVILLDWGKEQSGKMYDTVEKALTDTDGHGNTVALADAGSEIAEEVLKLDLCGLKWHIPTLGEMQLGYDNKTMLCAALLISGKEYLKDLWYWTSTRSGNKSNFVFDWYDGCWVGVYQVDCNRVRPVSAFSLDSL